MQAREWLWLLRNWREVRLLWTRLRYMILWCIVLQVSQVSKHQDGGAQSPMRPTEQTGQEF